MVGSNGRFLLGVLLGVLLGALVGAGLYHLSTGSQPSYADELAELVPGGAPEPTGDEPAKSAPLARPTTGPASLRSEGRIDPATLEPLSDGRVAALVDGVAEAQDAATFGSGAIRGRVVDPDGAALEGVVLRVARRDTSSRSTPGSSVGAAAPVPESFEDAVREAAERIREDRAHLREARTDASGAYRFEGLVDGSWTITAFLEGFQVLADSSATDVPVGSEVDFTATPVVEVPVQVYEPDGRLASRARLAFEGLGGGAHAATYGWTAEEPFLRLPAGDYELRAYSDDGRTSRYATRRSDPQEVTVAADGSTAPLRFDLRLRLAIRGVVQLPKDGTRVEDCVLRVMPLAPAQEVDLELLSRATKRTGNRPGAEFAFMDLDPGRYVIGVLRSSSWVVSAHEVVELQDESVRVTLALAPIDRSRYLAVTVLSPEGEVVDGAGLQVLANSSSGSVQGGGRAIRDREGRYLVAFEGETLRKYFDESVVKTDYLLYVRHEELGMRSVPLIRGQTELTVVFDAPARLEVTVLGYEGSGYEGRLFVNARKHAPNLGRAVSMGGGELGPDGVEEYTGLEPGLYVVTLSARPERSGAFTDQTEIERVEVQVGAGETTLQLSIPVLHSVRVHWADGKEGTSLGMRARREGAAIGGSSADLDADGYAVLENLRAGEYVLSASGVSIQQMYVTVPTKEVEFVPMEIDAMRVVIADPNGDLATVGFLDGDLVIGTDGEAFTDTPDLRLLDKLQSSKATQTTFLVLRGGKSLEIEVRGADLGGWSSRGGQFLPAQR